MSIREYIRTTTARVCPLCALSALAVVGCNREVDRGPVADLATVESFRTAFIATDASGEDGESAAASTGTGWATIRGQFVYDGDPPAMPPYDVNKEHSICTVNGEPPPQETLVIDDASRGIKNVAIFLRDAPRVHESAMSKDDDVVFDQKTCVFLTHVLNATVGQTIQIKNSDPTGHNTNILGSGFNRSIPAEGATYKVQREVAVPAKVICNIHPWMVAYMLMRENGYHAVTDNEGRFEIANVPAGEEIELQVWHESGGAAAQGLVGATPDSQDLKWSERGRVKVTLQPDEVKEIRVIVPPSAFRG